jgi:hypothetical protein
MMRRWTLAPLLRCFNHWRAEADALRAAREREEGERRLLEVMPGCSARWRRRPGPACRAVSRDADAPRWRAGRRS